MSHNHTPSINRRQALGLAAGVAGSALLGACGSGSAGPAKADSKLPLPISLPPKQLPGTHLSKVPGVAAAYQKLPVPGYVSVPKKPGGGGKTTAFTLTYGPPPTPLGSNVWHQAVNKALGVDLDLTIVPAENFGEKLVTTIASGQIPDLVTNEPSYRGRAARKFLPQGVFWDLRELIGGDKVKKYPNLARVPDYAWRNSRIDGAIYGVPNFRNQEIGGTICFRQDWAAKGGMPDKPKNIDELFAWLKAMKAGGGKNSYPLATIDQTFSFCGLQVYKAPNNWRLGKDGKLIKDLETDEYEQGLVFANKLWKNGLVHPDVLTLTPNPAQYQGYFFSGRVGICNAGIDGYFGTAGVFAMLRQRDHNAEPDVLIPPGWNGGLGLIPPDLGFYGMLSIPSSVKDKGRVAELLRIIDFLAAPIGSKEYYLTHYGVEGHNYEFKNGVPVASTDQKIASENFLSFLAQFNSGFFFPNTKDDALTCQRYAEQMTKAFVPDPTASLDSLTSFSKGDALSQMIQDYTQGIVTGRKPISALKDMRQRWKSGGGDQIRHELEHAIATEKAAEKKTTHK